ncbi:MAG: hypothetical protein J3K34DRAFT_423884 [Monoraphidium minutum]|nr:MAG: hypothetical protein J3K34DRAFT_423884 [Monoraphidium minutum]
MQPQRRCRVRPLAGCRAPAQSPAGRGARVEPVPRDPAVRHPQLSGHPGAEALGRPGLDSEGAGGGWVRRRRWHSATAAARRKRLWSPRAAGGQARSRAACGPLGRWRVRQSVGGGSCAPPSAAQRSTPAGWAGWPAQRQALARSRPRAATRR